MSDPATLSTLDNSSTFSLVSRDNQSGEIEGPNGSPQLVPRSSDLSWLLSSFFEDDSPACARRFYPAAPLVLLWAESLASFTFQFPRLAQLTKSQLLRRAKYEMMPLAVLALS